MGEIAALIMQANEPRSSWAYLFAVIVGTVVLLVFTRRKSRQAPVSPRARARERRGEFERRRSLDDDLRETMIELENLARQVNAQIETKYHKLEAVIRDADDRLARLEHVLSGGRAQREGASSLDITVDDVPKADTSSPAAAKDRHADHRRVYELADAGRSPMEIARCLDLSAGEVDLILAVRREKVKGGA